MFEDWNWTEKGLRVKHRVENLLGFMAVMGFFFVLNWLELVFP
jgi:hypothetical protein